MTTPEENNLLTKAAGLPWYRQFWPWFIIALPASVVIASMFTLWLAISNPDHLVVDEDNYRKLNSELKAQVPPGPKKEMQAGEPEPRSH